MDSQIVHWKNNYLLRGPWDQFHIVDLDRTDSYYNLIFSADSGEETLTFYDGTSLQTIMSIETLGQKSFSNGIYNGEGGVAIDAYLLPVLADDTFMHVWFGWDETGTSLKRTEWTEQQAGSLPAEEVPIVWYTEKRIVMNCLTDFPMQTDIA